MTKFLSIMPVLKVSDLDRSMGWYVDALGFVADAKSRDDGGAEYCFLHAGPTQMILSTGSHLGDVPGMTGTIYFRVVGVDELFNRVAGRSEVVWPLENQPYGTREFGIRDPDGYILAFAQRAE